MLAFSAKASDVYQKTRPDWPTTYPISGAVNVANFPSTQTVTVTNWPTPQPSILISNFPSTQTVAVANPSLSYFKSVSVSTAPLQIKAGSGEIWGFYIYNNAAAGNERSVKFFDKTTAPVVGTTASSWTITCGGRSGTPLPLHLPVPFTNGLWIIATTASGDTVTTGATSGEVSIWVLYR